MFSLDRWRLLMDISRVGAWVGMPLFRAYSRFVSSGKVMIVLRQARVPSHQTASVHFFQELDLILCIVNDLNVHSEVTSDRSRLDGFASIVAEVFRGFLHSLQAKVATPISVSYRTVV